jgi:hypothetical protein
MLSKKEPVMKELNEFVARENKWSSIFGSKPLSLQNAADRKKIAQNIDCALSPENLHCDGEISAAEANRKFRFLTKAAEQLMQLDPSVEIHEYY